MGELLHSTELQGMAKPKRVRSPRFSVPNKEQAVVSIGDELLKGTLHLLSLNGGTVRLDKKIAPGTFGEIRINTVSGTFAAAIEFLKMANANAQAFRIVAMGPTARKRLQDALDKMRGQGLAVNQKTTLGELRKLAAQIFSPRSTK
jgi:PilZ domain